MGAYDSEIMFGCFLWTNFHIISLYMHLVTFYMNFDREMFKGLIAGNLPSKKSNLMQ